MSALSFYENYWREEAIAWNLDKSWIYAPEYIMEIKF